MLLDDNSRASGIDNSSRMRQPVRLYLLLTSSLLLSFLSLILVGILFRILGDNWLILENLKDTLQIYENQKEINFCQIPQNCRAFSAF